VVGVAVGTVIGAVLLRAAISLYNKVAGGAGSPRGVREPAFGEAMGVTFATCLVNACVGVVLGLVREAVTAAAGPGARGGVNVLTQPAPVAVSLLVMAGLLSAVLPTTFGRALLVVLCYTLIVLVIGGAFVLLGVLFLGLNPRG
jgi:hypothetical protein